MHPREGFRRLLVASALAASGWTVSAAGSPGRPDLTTLVDGIGERLAEYYRHAQQLVCLERSTVTTSAAGVTSPGPARLVAEAADHPVDGADQLGDLRLGSHDAEGARA